MNTPVLPDDLRQEITALRQRFPLGSSALIPALYAVQARFGHVPETLADALAEALEVPPERVREVVTFYFMFNEKPVGRYHIFLCRNLSCWLRGSEDLRAHLESRLGIGLGETTPDGLFTLTGVECLGMCDHAPVMQINGEFHPDLTAEKIDAVLDALKTKSNHL